MATVQVADATEPPPAKPPSLWRNRDYMFWWTANGFSTLGTSVSTIAFPLLILYTTGSAGQAGSVTAAHMIGTLCTITIGGVLSDRVSRRAIMAIAPLVQAMAMGTVAFLVFRGDPSILVLCTLTLVGGLAAGLGSGVALAALRRLVPKDQVPSATAAGMGRDMVAQMGGAPLGGLLFSLTRWVPFLFDALSFLFVTLSALLIRRPLGPDRRTGDGPPPTVRADMADGFRMVRRSNYLVFTIIWGALLNVVVEAIILLFIVLVDDRGGGPTQVGMATSLALFGGVLGAVIGPALMRLVGARRVLILSGWLFVVCFASVVWFPEPWQIGLVLMVGMMSIVPLNVVTESYQVRLVPDAYLGRVASVNRFCMQSVQWMGPLGAGFLADALGVGTAVMVLAGCMTLLAIALHCARRQLRILDSPVSEVEQLEPPHRPQAAADAPPEADGPDGSDPGAGPGPGPGPGPGGGPSPGGGFGGPVPGGGPGPGTAAEAVGTQRTITDSADLGAATEGAGHGWGDGGVYASQGFPPDGYGAGHGWGDGGVYPPESSPPDGDGAAHGWGHSSVYRLDGFPPLNGYARGHGWDGSGSYPSDAHPPDSDGPKP